MPTLEEIRNDLERAREGIEGVDPEAPLACWLSSLESVMFRMLERMEYQERAGRRGPVMGPQRFK